ncbi:hypothetical protein NIES267_33240 [Calothrix parasitica NIES-267]|uniref:Uncharacterized protein n=1 Tax=Calothrix parasitica NIES-267 TaxID=1973488 RepID=A0A1Z4LRF8_9CYAN|nr:hypothetical protein NIES267_33240 [Calothrix parasitica NIES-267]
MLGFVPQSNLLLSPIDRTFAMRQGFATPGDVENDVRCQINLIFLYYSATEPKTKASENIPETSIRTSPPPKIPVELSFC